MMCREKNASSERGVVVGVWFDGWLWMDGKGGRAKKKFGDEAEGFRFHTTGYYCTS